MLPCPGPRQRIWSRDTDSAVPSLVSLLILHTRAESGAYSWDFSRFWRRRPLYICTANRHIGPVTSLSGHANAYRWRSLPSVRRHRASSSLQGSPSKRCFLSTFQHGPVNMCLSFLTPTIGMKWVSSSINIIVYTVHTVTIDMYR